MSFVNLKEEGYLLLKDVIPEKVVNRIRGFLEVECRKCLVAIRGEVPCSENIGELVSFIQNASEDKKIFNQLSQETRNILTGHFRLQARLSPLLQEIPRLPKILDILSKIFCGQSLRMHMPPMARFVLPKNPFAMAPPHQDVSYNKHLEEFYIMWVPLVKIDEQCGGLRIYEGTAFLEEQLKDLNRKFWLKGLLGMDYPKIFMRMSPGDVLFFNKNLVHESMPNHSENIRYSLDYRFFGSSTDSSKHYLDMSTWKTILPKESVEKR